MKKLIVCTLIVIFGMNASATVIPFAGPLTDAFLSVDLNGGKSVDLRPTEGSGAADAYGVVWTPWGGADGIPMPQAQEGVLPNTRSISKQFGAQTVTISAAGPAYNYDSGLPIYDPAYPIDSRDRGIDDGANDGYLFRDFIFGKKSGSNVQGTNYLQVEFDGLMAGQTYQLALYSYDYCWGSSVNWTAIAPTLQGYMVGWWSDKCSDDGYCNRFQAPADEQTITWVTNGAIPAGAVFNLTANALGKITVYGFGGNGISGDQNAENSYLNGFQISMLTTPPLPEPATVILLGLGSVLFRKRGN